MRKTIIGLLFCAACSFAYAGCRAITIEQVTRGHDLIEKISSEKKSLDQVKQDDCDDSRGFYASVRYFLKRQDKTSSGCNPCGGGSSGAVYAIGCSNGYDCSDGSLRDVSLGLDRKHLIIAMQQQLDDDMAELNKLGITP